MELDRPVTFEIVRRAVQPLNIENYLDTDGRRSAAPLLLVDAAEEDPADLRFLRDVYPRVPQPAEYWTVPSTDHYLHTGALQGRAVYNRRVMDMFVARVDQWLTQ
jgi:hypothetical protein